MKPNGALVWIKDQHDPKLRQWEEFYRNRWQHDKIVRSTHGVNCTGGCTWQIYVKDGIVTWEMQGLDYPSLEASLPPYEPRGCQRGISFSWYIYSPLRVKYPYARGALLDLWVKARAQHEDPVEAWKSLVENPQARGRWQRARGKGGFRRVDWDSIVELISAANIYTIKKWGPDRIAGFSPIPAMSMISYAGGARMLQLMGAVSLSFYDWFCDLPPASPETWGEQTDVHESADWFNAKLLAVVGSNLNMTRTPDCHFAAEARYNGTKMWVFSPDFSQVSKYADEWVGLNAGQDGAWWMAVNHVILQESHHEKKTPYFLEYLRKFTDAPYLVVLDESEQGALRPGRLLRANRLDKYAGIENGDWQFLMWDETAQAPRMPMGSVGFRWAKEKGKWNLRLRDGLDGSDIRPVLSFLDTVPKNGRPDSMAHGHTMDTQVKAVRNGWLPFYPQFDRSPLEVVTEAEEAGAKSPEEIVAHAVDRLKNKELKFAVEDPDAPENWPRVWFIWRGNALMSSAKGHEYFLKHYLGTHTNAIAEDIAKDSVKEVTWHDKAPQGKMDLVVDLNFRMDTSALYSDIVLPAATWYEKSDLNSTDMHSFIHPLSAAVPPCWESKSDWQIFQTISKKFSELAEKHFPEPVKDIVALALTHDTPAEIAQPEIRDWSKGETEPVPGKTMPALKVVSRDYKNLYNQFISFGPKVRESGLGAHGTHYNVEDVYDEAVMDGPRVSWDGKAYPSLAEDIHVCDQVLRFATVTNGELAYRSYQDIEEKTGLPLAHLAEKNRGVRVSFADLQSQPRRFINSPMWSGLIENGRAYAPFTYNVENDVPWRTLTGRQHFYLDHPGYIDFGEHLPTYKPKPLPAEYADLRFSKEAGPSLMLNYLTPHGKWHIHSTYGDNQRMTTLSRGCEPFWINHHDAAEIDIEDNDWVEVHNDHGVVVTRAAVSARIPRGICIQYHSPERTLGVPRSPLRGNRRAGGHNSLTRVRLKPNLMVGGYGQFTYHFNYWGPTGVNRDTHILVRKLPELKW